MAIKKQEFYEGAALHRLARRGDIPGIRYDAPFFVFDNRLLVLLKYSTRTRSPWGFTFMPDEQAVLSCRALERDPLVIAMVCGGDGIAAIGYDTYLTIAAPRATALRVSCGRLHGKHYSISGPDGSLSRKVAPSDWHQILVRQGKP
jgi:hypothetical protein